MKTFATEFPAKPGLQKAKFVAAVIAWIRGIDKSTVLDKADARELYEDEARLETANGEVLSIKSYETTKTKVFGVRFELPDKQNRIWRTESVYSDFGQKAVFRTKVHCVASSPDAELLAPKNPFFVKQSIRDGWGNIDGLFEIAVAPHELTTNDVDLARATIRGEASSYLPCVYISRKNNNTLPIDANRLAEALLGTCHVVVEPTRGFSFELMEATGGSNPFGGAIAVFAPGGQTLARVLNPRNLWQVSEECGAAANRFMSDQAAQSGWEWHELQEAQAKFLRQKALEGSSDDLAEYEQLVQEEIDAKNEQIERLKQRLETEISSREIPSHGSSDLVPLGLAREIGPEIYDGEFSDRLRLFIEEALKNQPDFDERTIEFARRYLSTTSFSGKAEQLAAQIKVASKDGNQMPKRLGQILTGIGYIKSNEGKHLKFTPPQELFGLPNETLPSTPSDSQRGGKNRGNEVANSFNLKRLQ